MKKIDNREILKEIDDIDVISEYVDRHWKYSHEMSRATNMSDRITLNDVYKISSSKYVGHISLYKDGIIVKAFFFGKNGNLLFVSERDNNYRNDHIDDPESYIKSLKGINKYKL